MAKKRDASLVVHDRASYASALEPSLVLRSTAGRFTKSAKCSRTRVRLAADWVGARWRARDLWNTRILSPIPNPDEPMTRDAAAAAADLLALASELVELNSR
jgi:hypothetical protein